MKRKAITVMLLVCIMLNQLNLNPSIRVEANSVEKQYIIISETDEGHSVLTKTMTQNEAADMKLQENIVVVERDGEVSGSWFDSETNETRSDVDSVSGSAIDKEFMDIFDGWFDNNLFSKEQHEKEVEDSYSSEDDWNMNMINVDTGIAKAAANSVSGSAIKIALIDSGVNYDENINIVERKNFIEDDENVSYLYEDTSGHGTSIAGIISSRENADNDVIGINNNAEIYSARVLDDHLDAPISRVVKAIYWAIDKGVNIINISFGTTENSEALKIAIQDACNAGILIIAAAGNHAVVEYPAAYAEVMAVGSVDTKGDISDFSPSGNELEVVAPGENIISSAAFGGEMISSGTSLAVAHVVGTASVLWQQDPSASADSIRCLIDYSANLYGDSKSYGNGLVDLNYALQIHDEFEDIYESDNLQPYISNAEKEANLESRINRAEAEGVISENSNSLDIGYVKGSWTGKGHDGIDQYIYSSKKYKWDADIYTAFMNGCKYQDKDGSGLQGITEHPQFHGYLWNSNDNCLSNYIDCYIFLTRVANKLNQGIKLTDLASLRGSYMSDTDFNAMNVFSCSYYTEEKKKVCSGNIGNKTWAQILGDAGVANTNKTAAAFVYGMAVHTSTDVLAHSTWQPTVGADGNTSYTKISHSDSDVDGNYDADQTDFGAAKGTESARYKAAKYITNKTISRCNTSSIGVDSDFYMADKYFDINNDSNIGTQDFLIGNYLSNEVLSGSTAIKSYYHGDVWYQCYDMSYMLDSEGKIAMTTLSANTLTVTKGSTATLTATVAPTNSTVKWKSSKTSVATVSSTGLITGKKAGNATITATANGASATCEVIVQ